MRSLLYSLQRRVPMENELWHFGRSKRNGAKIGSGRYPLGSGENPRAARRRSTMTADEKREYVKNAAADKAYRQTVIENSKTKQVKRMVDETNNLIGQVKRYTDDNIRRGTQKKKLDLSKMTDKELRDKINRENLERQYNQLFAPDEATVSKGEAAVNRALTYGGLALTATSTALSVALAIKQLRAKG